MMNEAELASYLKERQDWVNRALAASLPAESTHPPELYRAVRYSLLSEGKRIRPVLCMAACEALGGDPRAALGFGCAVEYVHAYSLIHDDLPAMDDDDFRRGRPTSHKMFGEAAAILAGDALNTEAFLLIVRSARERGLGPGPTLAVVEELAASSGFAGVVAGQVVDLAKQNQPCSAAELEFIHRHKTAALIRAAVRIGALTAGADAAGLKAVTGYGEAIGFAFQVVDDILDADDPDKAHETANYVKVHGPAAARERAGRLCREALAALEPLGPPADSLRTLARYIVERKN